MELYLFTFLVILPIVSGVDIVVDVEEGSLKGIENTSRNGQKFLAFLGVPYAEPPIENLRFKDPIPKKNWSGVKDATTYGNVCIQFEKKYTGSEDCLVLSVYTAHKIAALKQVNQTKLYPVMIHFHGGTFITGSSQGYYTPEYLMDNNLVLITVNYRLGPLGFLSLEDNIISGNMGLLDQALAIKWVTRNIKQFGGDPKKITLLGESVGGISVNLHMYSPLSKDLFQQGISISGSSNTPLRHHYPGEARKWALMTAELMNCPTTNSSDILQCLQAKPVVPLITVQHSIKVSFDSRLILYLPIVDKFSSNPFLPEDPYVAQPDPKPWFTGCSELDGALIGRDFFDKDNLDVLQQNFDYIIPQIMYYSSSLCNVDEVTSKLRQFYFGNEPINLSKIRKCIDMLSDFRLIWPMVKSLSMHQGKRYVYYTTYVGKNNFQSRYGVKDLNGTVHVDENIYIWKYHQPVSFPDLTGKDLEFSKKLIKLLINFVTYGNPTQSGFNFDWPLWNNDKKQYVNMANDGFHIEQNFLSQRMKLWSNLPYCNKISSEKNRRNK